MEMIENIGAEIAYNQHHQFPNSPILSFEEFRDLRAEILELNAEEAVR